MTKIISNKSNVDLDYPICRPSLDLDFTQEELDPRITFSRGSIGTRVNRNRLIETVAANQPRFDYDPVTGECKGLLIEDSRINYELYSGDPTQWTLNTNMTLTGNSIVLPDGTTSTNVEYRGTDSGANVKILRPGPSGAAVVAGETWTFSIFLRAGTEKTVHLVFQNQTGGDSVGCLFDLVTGQFPGSITGSNAANGSRGVQYVGNGWYRVWLTNTYQSSNANQQTFVRLRTNSTSVQYTTSFSAWGAQLERGTFPTSYIPTTASTVTRSADLAEMTGTNFSSWYNSSEGSMVASFSTIYEGSQVSARTPGVWGLSQPTTQYANSNGYGLTVRSDTRQFQFAHRFISTDLNINEALIPPTSSLTVQPYIKQKVSCSYLPYLMRMSINGATVLQIKDRNYNSLSQTALLIGTQRIGGATIKELTGHISRLTYYPRALNPNQLQTLTS